MDAKEKSEELMQKFKRYAHGTVVVDGAPMTDNSFWDECSKQCALICVGQCVSELDRISMKRSAKTVRKEYWNQVKAELEKR